MVKAGWLVLTVYASINYYLIFVFSFFNQRYGDPNPLTIWNFAIPYAIGTIFTWWFLKDILLGVKPRGKKSQLIILGVIALLLLYHFGALPEMTPGVYTLDSSPFAWFVIAHYWVSLLGVIILRLKKR